MLGTPRARDRLESVSLTLQEPITMPAPAVDTAVRAFLSTLVGKSPRTERTYASSLRRLTEFMEEEGLAPASLPTDALPATLLEKFHEWLVRSYGRDRRATITTYLAAARAFIAFLDRRGLLPVEASSERMRGHLRDVVVKGNYKTPRIDRGLPLVVLEAENAPPPEPGADFQRHMLERLR